MSEDPLSQAEIDSLLGAVSDRPAGAPPRARAAVAQSTKSLDVTPSPGPARLSPEHLRAIRGLHEKCCRKMESALSALLRSTVELTLTTIDLRTYSEFVFGLESPTCFCLLHVQPSGTAADGSGCAEETRLGLDLSPSIVFPLIDRLLGGTGDAGPPQRRALTAIEVRLIGRVTQVLVSGLQHVWRDVQPLRISLERIVGDPQTARLFAPNAGIVQVGVVITLGRARGVMTLACPLELLGPLLRLSQTAPSAQELAEPASTAEKSTPQDETNTRGALVEVVAELAETTITPQDLSDLCPGDIITTGHGVSRPVLVRVEGLPKFLAHPGHLDGRRAIRIEERSNRTPSARSGE